MKEAEHRLQVACVNWFRYQYQPYSKLLFAIPNGGQRNAVTGAKLKAEGVVAGIPDLFLAMPKAIAKSPTESYHAFSGLFIEMKIRPNKPTKHQQDMIKKLIGQGYKVTVCYSLDEFMIAIQSYIGK